MSDFRRFCIIYAVVFGVLTVCALAGMKTVHQGLNLLHVQHLFAFGFAAGWIGFSRGETRA